MEHFIVERFVPGITGESVRLWRQQIADSITALQLEAEVQYLGSELVSKDETCFCFFDASTPSVIQRVNEHARVPFERILSGEAVGSGAREGAHG